MSNHCLTIVLPLSNPCLTCLTLVLPLSYPFLSLSITCPAPFSPSFDQPPLLPLNLQFTSLPDYQFTSLPVYQFTSLPVYQFISLPVYQFTSLPVYQFTSLPVWQFTSLLVYQFTSLPVYTFTSLPVYQFTCLTNLPRHFNHFIQCYYIFSLYIVLTFSSFGEFRQNVKIPITWCKTLTKLLKILLINWKIHI